MAGKIDPWTENDSVDFLSKYFRVGMSPKMVSYWTRVILLILTKELTPNSF
jgi:hypothetical protein